MARVLNPLLLSTSAAETANSFTPFTRRQITPGLLGWHWNSQARSVGASERPNGWHARHTQQDIKSPLVQSIVRARDRVNNPQAALTNMARAPWTPENPPSPPSTTPLPPSRMAAKVRGCGTTPLEEIGQGELVGWARHKGQWVPGGNDWGEGAIFIICDGSNRPGIRPYKKQSVIYSFDHIHSGPAVGIEQTTRSALHSFTSHSVADRLAGMQQQ